MKQHLQTHQQIQRTKDQIVSIKKHNFQKTNKLIEIHNSLEETLSQNQKDLELAESLNKVPLKELILYSHRISGTSLAPSGWNYQDPLPISFRPPAPQEHEMRSTALFYNDTQQSAPKPIIKVTKLTDAIRVSIFCSLPSASIRYTIDNSMPSALTGKVYDQPFDLPVETDCAVKVVAIAAGYRESELSVASVAETAFPMPAKVEHMAERPAHVVSGKDPLDLGMDISPYSSSRISSDEESEYSSPFHTFGR